jgi:uncharacterized protein YrzB (UPF0473 family)
MDKEELDMELIFSFTCKENGKNYVALDNKQEIFEKNSRYANIDIFEIVQVKSKSVYISDIKDEDWDAVKHALQYNVFAKMN